MRWNSRKLFVTLAGLASGVSLAYIGKLDTASATLIGGLVSGYLTSNVGQKAWTRAPE